MGKKFLSEVINEHKEEIIGTTTYYNGVDSEQSNTDLILITAGVGAGKNTWVQKCLTQELTGFENILFITSRKLIKEQMLKDVDFQDDYINCQKFRTNYTITHHSLKRFFESPEKFEQLIDLNFKYIVIDEIHSLIADASYTDTAFYLYTLIKYYNAHNVKVICLSATTKNVLPFLEYFENFKHFDFSEECKNVKPQTVTVISKSKAFQLLSKADSNNKMIYMANSVNDVCNKYYKKLAQDYKIKKSSIGIVINDNRCTKEKNNTKDKGLKSCLDNMPSLVEHIVHQEKLPKKVNVLLASSRIREGVNIQDDNIKAMFCESHNAIDILQFSGRYRGNVETLYIINDTISHYKEDDIEKLDLEYNFLSSFELNNINIYSSILLYKATGIKTSYLTDKNFNHYLSTIKMFPNSLLDKKLLFVENDDKTLEELNNFDKEYYSKAWHDFNVYIQAKYPLLRYNIILNKYELYYAKYYYIKEEFNNYTNYKKDTLAYLTDIFQMDIIDIDESIYKTASSIKEDTRISILYYLYSSNYLNTLLTREKQNEILADIKNIYSDYFTQNYSSLGILLKAYNIKTQRKGANKNGNIIITDTF